MRETAGPALCAISPHVLPDTLLTFPSSTFRFLPPESPTLTVRKAHTHTRVHARTHRHMHRQTRSHPFTHSQLCQSILTSREIIKQTLSWIIKRQMLASGSCTFIDLYTPIICVLPRPGPVSFEDRK